MLVKEHLRSNDEIQNSRKKNKYLTVSGQPSPAQRALDAASMPALRQYALQIGTPGPPMNSPGESWVPGA